MTPHAPEELPTATERDRLTALFSSMRACVADECTHTYDWQCAQAWLTDGQQDVTATDTLVAVAAQRGSRRRIIDDEPGTIRPDVPTPVQRGLARHIEAVDDLPAPDTGDEVGLEFLDDDGYPTDHALECIRTWDGTAEDLTAFLDDLIGYGHLKTTPITDDFDRACIEVTFVTGGWSGAEHLLGALEGTFFWFAYWQLSQRGGLVRFQVPADQYRTPMPVLPSSAS